MSDNKKTKEAFTNEDTIVRRAWIDSALASVRGRLQSRWPDPDAATAGTRPDDVAQEDQDARTTEQEPRNSRGPRLHLAWSGPERRSGT